MSEEQKKPAKRDIKESDLKVIAWAGYIVMGVLALVIALQDPSVLRAAVAENEAHRAALDACSQKAKEDLHARMQEGEFTLYGSFIRMPGVQLKCLSVEAPAQ